jgi:hypothetical protein
VHYSQDRTRTCTKGWFPYQLHKVITPCFTCHVTLCGHSMLPKVSYDHLTILEKICGVAPLPIQPKNFAQTKPY